MLHEAELSRTQYFRLLDLPPEIWSNIGKLVVDNKPPLTYRAIWWARDERCSTPWTQQPAIARTCRILRQELLLYYYKNTPLRYVLAHTTSCQAVGIWLRAIGKHNRLLMGVISIGVWSYAPMDTLRKELSVDWKVEFELHELEYKRITPRLSNGMEASSKLEQYSIATVTFV